MKEFKMTVHYLYEYNSKDDAINHKEELTESGLVFVELYENHQSNWVCKYEKIKEKEVT